jgi:hypothetical protein
MHNSESDEDSEIKKTSRSQGVAQRGDAGEGGSGRGDQEPTRARGRPKRQYEYKEDDESEDDDDNDGNVASEDMVSEEEPYGGSKRKPRKPVVESTRYVPKLLLLIVPARITLLRWC